MKFLISLLLLSVSFCWGSDFSKADTIMQNAVRTRQLTAKTLVQTKTDLENADRLIASAKHHLESLNRKIVHLQELKNVGANANSELAKSIESDVKNLEKLSAFLDKFCEKILNDLPKDIAKKYSKISTGFKDKTVVEKLRAVSALIESILEDDKAFVVGSDGSVSTGVFVRASGKISGDISELKVERLSK